MRNSAVVAVFAAVVAIGACGKSPSAPTALPPQVFTPFNGDLSGAWIGEYAITGCEPRFAPNSCTTYIPPAPETMTLTLSQSGSALSGTLQSGVLGPLAVTGTVDAAGIVHLTGAQPGAFRCFLGGERATEIGDWTTEITKSGEMRGTFRQSVQQILSSCYTARFDYFTEVLSLRRSGTTPAPPVATLPSPDSMRVAGRVLDYRTGAPVASVAMVWHGRSDGYAVLGSDRVVSSNSGQYSALVPPASYYALTFEDPAAAGWGVVRLLPGVLQTDILVAPGACNWVAYGTVVDAASRRPVEGVRMDISGRAVFTRPDGTYLNDIGCAPAAGQTAVHLVATHTDYNGQGQWFWDADAQRGIHRLDFALVPR